MIPVVAACIINEGYALLQSRKLDKNYREFWNFPGGKVKTGETLEEALAREINEELGAIVLTSQLIHAQVNKFTHYTDSFLVLFYEVRLAVYPPEGIDSIGNSLRWIPFGELHNFKVIDGTREALQKLRQLVSV